MKVSEIVSLGYWEKTLLRRAFFRLLQIIGGIAWVVLVLGIFFGLPLYMIEKANQKDQIERSEKILALSHQFDESGILGEHELRRIEQRDRTIGNVNGNFFLACGGFSGNLNSETMLQFYWGRTPGELFATALPYSMFRFVVDESKSVPSVQFIFYENALVQDFFDYPGYLRSVSANPNLIIDNKKIGDRYLLVAIVRISSRDLEREVYLPNKIPAVS